MEPVTTDTTDTWTDAADTAISMAMEESRVDGALYLAVIAQAKPGVEISGVGLIQRSALKTDRSGPSP